MAAPEYVPVKPMEDVRAYSSPPRRPEPWRADRPGDLRGGQPVGDGFGAQGPDQGYALALARRFEHRLVLAEGERAADAVAGCLGIALKRASLHGRAPLVHDLTVAYTLWGFLDPSPPADLLERRRQVFAGVAESHDYVERRAIVDAVPESTLRLPHTAVSDAFVRDWRSMIDLDALPPPSQH